MLVAGAGVGLAMLYGESSASLPPSASIPAATARVAITGRPAAQVVAPQVVALQAVALRAAAPVKEPPGGGRYATMFDPSLSTAASPMRFSSSLTSASIFASAPARAQARDAAETDPAPRAPDTAGLAADGETTQVAAIADRPGSENTAVIADAGSQAIPYVPLPLPRPAGLPSTPAGARAEAPRRVASLEPMPPPPAPTERNSFFDKLFGSGARPATPALAYAPPDSGIGGFGWGHGDAPIRETAVYNIATHTVTLPDGTKLEAHSGLGANLDDPRSVAMRMRGATPPNTYDLTLREAAFHGVRALRLTPTGGTTFGRGGLLAHTFMLGPRGDSNGCVVFRDYAAFLRAYESGAVRRLVVVAGI